MPSGNLGNSTVLLSHQDLDQDLDNNPLDNLSDLRDIHQFDIDLTNYTDHEAVESDIEVPAFNDHFDILPQMDTRDYHNSSEDTQNQRQQNLTLNPALYDVVTSSPVEDEAFDSDFNESNEGMDEKYFTLLENLRKKITAEKAAGKGREIHQEVNDVLHPLISLMAIKPNSMRLLVKPKTLDINSKVKVCKSAPEFQHLWPEKDCNFLPLSNYFGTHKKTLFTLKLILANHVIIHQ